MARVGVGEVGTQPSRIRPSTSRTDQIIIMEVPWIADPDVDNLEGGTYIDDPDKAVDAVDSNGKPIDLKGAFGKYKVGPADWTSDTPVAKGEFHKRQLLIAEATLRQGGETIDVPYKTGNAAGTRAAEGPTDLQEGLTIIGSCDGTELLWRMITQDLNPSWHRIGYSDIRVLNDAGQSATGTTRYDIANTGVTLTEAKDVPNSQKCRITVTLSDNAAIDTSSSNDEATIVLTGENPATTETLTFVTATGTAPTSGRYAHIDKSRTLTTKAYFGNIKTIVGEGFSAGTFQVSFNRTTEYDEKYDLGEWTSTGSNNDTKESFADDQHVALNAMINPVQIEVTPVPSGPSAGKVGVVVIRGKDKDGLQLEEILRFRQGQTKARKTRHFFASVDAEGLDFENWSPGKIEFKVQDRASRVTFQPQDQVLAIFWLIELTKGITPNTYNGVLVNQLTASIARDTAMEFALTVLGRKGAERRNLKGETGPLARRSDATALENASTTVFAGWQCQVSVNGWISPLLGATLTINQNLSNADVITGDRHQESPPIPGPNRDCMVEGNIVYAPENNMSQWYLDNEVLPDVKVEYINSTKGSFLCKTTIEYDECYLSQNPDPASPREGRVEQPFSIMSFVDEIGGPPKDYRIVCDFPDYAPVRDMTAYAQAA